MNKNRYYVDYSHAYMGYVVKDSQRQNHLGDAVVPHTQSHDWQGAQVKCNELNQAPEAEGVKPLTLNLQS
jgi:hypothetical protein